MPLEFTCGECGNRFMRPTRRVGPRGVFCSLPCYWFSNQKLVPHRTCLGCGDVFDPRVGGGRKPNLTRDHCNRTCYDKKRAFTLERWLECQGGAGCWLWPFGLNADGYGVTQRHDSGKQELVHRAAWQLLVGPIPKGLTLDHMCHNRDLGCTGGRLCLHRRCANPADLVLAESAENTLRGKGPGATNARKTQCVNGHPYTSGNTYLTPAGARQCRTCQAERSRRYRERSIG